MTTIHSFMEEKKRRRRIIAIFFFGPAALTALVLAAMLLYKMGDSAGSLRIREQVFDCVHRGSRLWGEDVNTLFCVNPIKRERKEGLYEARA